MVELIEIPDQVRDDRVVGLGRDPRSFCSRVLALPKPRCVQDDRGLGGVGYLGSESQYSIWSSTSLIRLSAAPPVLTWMQ